MRPHRRAIFPSMLGALALGCASTGIEPPEIAPPPLVLETVVIDEELTARRLDERTWVITHDRPYPANSLVAISDHGKVLLVDTPWTPDATRTLLEWIDDELQPTAFSSVSTHFHLDAIGGNPALRDAGIGGMSHALTPRLLELRGRRMLRDLREGLKGRPEEKRKLRDVELIAPQAGYMASMATFPFGSESYSLIYGGPSHSKDSVAVLLPERGILFGGCMVKSGGGIGYVRDADLENWPEAVRNLKQFDARVVIPGHGDRLDPSLLDHTLDLLAADAAARAHSR